MNIKKEAIYNKKNMFGILLLVLSVTFVGCSNSSKSEIGNNDIGENDIVCSRKNDYSTNTLERELIFKFDNNKKLMEVIDTSKYTYSDDSNYKKDCETVKKTFENKENISGAEDTYKCDDSDKTILVVSKDTIKELDEDAKKRRYKELNDDGTFDFEEWKSTVGEKNKWECNK